MNYEVVKDWKFDPNECKFDPGEIHVTPEAKMLEQNGVDLKLYLFRHLRGNWGDGLDNREKAMTDWVLEERSHGECSGVVSEYNLSNHRQLVITTFFPDSETIIDVSPEKSTIESIIDVLIGEWDYLEPQHKLKLVEVIGKDGNLWIPYEQSRFSKN